MLSSLLNKYIHIGDKQAGNQHQTTNKKKNLLSLGGFKSDTEQCVVCHQFSSPSSLQIKHSEKALPNKPVASTSMMELLGKRPFI